MDRSTDGQLTQCHKVGWSFYTSVFAYWVRSTDESVHSCAKCIMYCTRTIQLCPLYLVHLNSGLLLHIDRPNHYYQSITGQRIVLLMGLSYSKAKGVRCAYFRPGQSGLKAIHISLVVPRLQLAEVLKKKLCLCCFRFGWIRRVFVWWQ